MAPMGAFAERLAEPGVVEQCSLAGTFGFMAYHGGELEKQTDVIATEAAASSGASLYVVCHPADDHITSTLVRRADSDLLDRFLDHVEVVVTVHGYGREHMFTSLLLGGTNRPLARALRLLLEPAMPDYEIIDDLDRIPPGLRGLHDDNPVNLPRGGGVQLELPPRARGLGPRWAGWRGDGHVPPMTALIDRLAALAREWSGGDDAARRAP